MSCPGLSIVLLEQFVLVRAWHMAWPLREGPARALLCATFLLKNREWGRRRELFSVSPDLWILCTFLLGICESCCTLHWDQMEPAKSQVPQHYQRNRALINPESHEPSSTCSVQISLEHHRISPTNKLHYRVGHHLPIPSHSWSFSSCG